MLFLKTNQLRQLFIEFFIVQHKHKNLPSSSLIPKDDPSILFINSGMSALKKFFLDPNLLPLDNRSIVTAQRCLRAGGKHNDLDNVGYTDRHHTFFEMLGNFSFGAYSLEESMTWSYQFLTNILSIPKEKLYFSYITGDDNTLNIWKKLTNLPSEHFFACEDNFWSMGKVGPCGTCTEIFYSKEQELLEIWNIVNMSQNRLTDGSLVDLAIPCIDTGMGLERLASVIQEVESNYDIDTIKMLKDYIQAFTGCNHEVTLRVLSDHMRASVMLIFDCLYPGNKWI
jgi:alanyl-tRNA synthetase